MVMTSDITRVFLAIERQCMSLCDQARCFADLMEAQANDLTGASYLRRLISTLDAVVTSVVIGLHARGDARTDEYLDRLHELVTRAETSTILLQLEAIGSAVESDTTRELSRALFSGSGLYQSFDELAAFVLGDVARLNRLWLQYRQLSHSTRVAEAAHGHRDEIQRKLLRCARRDVLRSISALAFDPGFKDFLSTGKALSDWPEVAKACEQIDGLIQQRLEAEIVDPVHWGAAPILWSTEDVDLQVLNNHPCLSKGVV